MTDEQKLLWEKKKKEILDFQREWNRTHFQ